MTDAEISRRLALAIGWEEKQIEASTFCDSVILPSPDPGENYRVFDYRDPAVIWPIAEKFGAFPMKNAMGSGWVAITEEVWLSGKEFAFEKADTAAKAVALAVIAAKGG